MRTLFWSLVFVAVAIFATSIGYLAPRESIAVTGLVVIAYALCGFVVTFFVHLCMWAAEN